MMVAIAKKKERGFPVLNYHGLVPSESRIVSRKSRFGVTDVDFVSHLEQIRRGTFAVRPLSELWADRVGSKKVLALTFDDGRASDHEIAFPLLAQAGFAGDFFINPAMIGRDGYLTWAQVREMHQTGMSFHSHGQEHVDHSRLSMPELRRQLCESKREIEDRVGAEVPFFAAPYGEWNRRVADVAGEAGYRAICTTSGQLAEPEAEIIDRICIHAGTTTEELATIIAGDPVFSLTNAFRFRLRRIPKSVALRVFPAAVDAWRDRHHE